MHAYLTLVSDKGGNIAVVWNGMVCDLSWSSKRGVCLIGLEFGAVRAKADRLIIATDPALFLNMRILSNENSPRPESGSAGWIQAP